VEEVGRLRKSAGGQENQAGAAGVQPQVQNGSFFKPLEKRSWFGWY
jgi:hypothetical protein